MKNQILIIDSSSGQRYEFLTKIIQRLILENFWFWFLGKPNGLAVKFKTNHWPNKQRRWGWQKSGLASSLNRPWLLLISFWNLYWYKHGRSVKTIICFNWPEKIIYTPIAKFLKMKVIWLELPNVDYQSLPKKLQEQLFKQASLAKVVCLTSASRRIWLERGLPEENCFLILPGIKLEDYLYQENIYDNLANSGGQSCFTIGTAVDFSEEQRIEMLLQAVQICLGLDQDIRLVIIGNADYRKKINWLIKKMRLEHQVWLVSDQVSLKKWFNNFQIFVVASSCPDLDTLVVSLGAMANGLTVVGPTQAGLGDLSFNNQAMVLAEMTDAQALAHQLIGLQQNPPLRQELGINAKGVVNKYFVFERVIKEWLSLLKN